METGENLGKVAEHWREELKQAAGEIAERMVVRESQVLASPMAEMEELAVAVSRQLGQEIFRTLLARQAETAENPALRCPQCGEPCKEKPPRRRELTTRLGEVCWHEPVYDCRQCRRSFSPSVRDVAD
jgi:uncharacterized protein with PIN domain